MCLKSHTSVQNTIFDSKSVQSVLTLCATMQCTIQGLKTVQKLSECETMETRKIRLLVSVHC